MKNKLVVENWQQSCSASNHRGSLWTDGQKLYSYKLQIGDTTPKGLKVLKDYTAPGVHGFQSQTTSCHVNLAKRVADVVA